MRGGEIKASIRRARRARLMAARAAQLDRAYATRATRELRRCAAAMASRGARAEMSRGIEMAASCRASWPIKPSRPDPNSRNQNICISVSEVCHQPVMHRPEVSIS